MRRPLLWLCLAVLVQTAILVVMIGLRQYLLVTGTDVVLEMRPVDPRSLFRGDYVRLNYAISSIDVDQLAGDDEFVKGDTAYVRLRKAEPVWIPVSIHHDRPKLAAGEVAIRGRVRALYPTGLVQIRYGIESYFIPEGEGRSLERPKPGEKVTVLLAVSSSGSAAVKAVLVDGKPRYVESLF